MQTSWQSVRYIRAAVVAVHHKLCGRPPQYAPAPCKLTFDLLTLKVAAESRLAWATCVPILVFLGLSFLDLGPMYTTDRRTSDVSQMSDAHHRLMPPPYGDGGIMTNCAGWRPPQYAPPPAIGDLNSHPDHLSVWWPWPLTFRPGTVVQYHKWHEKEVAYLP